MTLAVDWAGKTSHKQTKYIDMSYRFGKPVENARVNPAFPKISIWYDSMELILSVTACQIEKSSLL